MPRSHLSQWIEGHRAWQVVAAGLALSIFALPTPALAQSGLIGGLVGGMINQGFQQPSPPQYYQPPPQQYYQPSSQQYYPQQMPQNNQPQWSPTNTQQLQQTDQRANDQSLRDEEEAERLRQKRAAAIAAKKARTQNLPAEQKGPTDTTVAAVAPMPPSAAAPPDAAVQQSATAQPNATTQPSPAAQPGTATLPVFADQTSYADARSRLIALGYGPSPAASQHCDPAKDASCYPEREFCFGSTVIQCNFGWTHGNTVIRVQTANLPPTIAKVECVDNCQ